MTRLLGSEPWAFALGSDVVDSPLTTPEADEISRYARRAKDAGATHFVMEVSSHALSQSRVDAVRFRAAAFTNLTQDHLDYHASMEEYAEAKVRLFTELGPAVSVLNVDDELGQQIVKRARGPVVRVSRHAGADVYPIEASIEARGIHARIKLPTGEVELSSRLVGEHNLENLLLTLAVVDALGLDASLAAREMEHAPMVPGRLERCDEPSDDLVVLVDYAHTPDALTRALQTCRALASGEVICVFGCGGDRDPDKRPRMGDAVGFSRAAPPSRTTILARKIPAKIAHAIEQGLAPHGIVYDIELDRALAIERAIASAQGGDVVLVAGKGHEPYQIIGSERRDFDDRVEARRALAHRRNERS